MNTFVQKKRITIATGIFPPEIGGPAQYAVMLRDGFVASGHRVHVKTYGMLKKLPTGIRHIAYTLRLIPVILFSDVVVVLDTFSAAVPAVFISRLFGKKTYVRVGGDFLWEQYVERTHESILLSHFYTENRAYSRKEKMIFSLTRWVFQSAHHIVFSTAWQRDITIAPYSIDPQKVSVIENLYESGAKRNIVPKEKVILSPSRDIVLKNKKCLDEAFSILKERFFDISLDTHISSREALLQRISSAYVLVVPSLSEVSPNIVIDAVRLGVPVVVTSDCGIADRLSDVVVWVNPHSPQSIADGIASLLDASKYSEYMARLSLFTFVHTQEDIIREFERLF